ncbi:peptidoglycan editing factor PgeF [Bariatricus massiliensis]|uniref:Purine nucleoside phosphorylase n=1 Tax=Bariatricus massiliensis TaxID=1745713 RepID=A0ABS8DCF5_9FIRM|nr:peptidoglycan editing factor PgeF [Bariatricus massiliensis]MCB7303297.1 peptidoglycan editing factor PgeF [Bariatricus massiliensis]MCB7373429.1 peptidoglycan editing factor PgeF [Bariatricus massiliensis]MCB7386099.1 peptidoglycan editing factor PgeF [Bariatricus massiliensis]MCB7410261.1 peptidoglycan editing factor PgeF [Bariatricus massiliensis]MCQ5252455.1 peptidoglycan editing factor PgeF [Bariatricus massiliensis]
MRFEYKNAEHIYTEKNCNGVLFLEFPLLSETGVVRHGISTREGGVSEGIYRSMNLSFARGDKEEHVMENYRRIGAAIGVSPDRMTASSQTHTTNVRAVTEDDIGKGIVYPRDYTDVDGLMTNLPDVCLVTYYADCVPLLFVDPVHRAIASSHSGWRGTVNRMGEITVQAMQRAYGSRPEDIVAAIGPSICQDCYEVSEDVIERFRAAFPETEWASLFYGKPDGKFQLNLWRANELILLRAGIKREHLAVTNLCTCCNSELLFSHRASHGKRGNLAAFLALK